MTIPDLSGIPYKTAEILRQIIAAINGIQSSPTPAPGEGSGSTVINQGGGPWGYRQMALSGDVTLTGDDIGNIIYITNDTGAQRSVYLPTTAAYGSVIGIMNSTTSTGATKNLAIYGGVGAIAVTQTAPGAGSLWLANGRGGWTYLQWAAWTPGANL